MTLLMGNRLRPERKGNDLRPSIGFCSFLYSLGNTGSPGQPAQKLVLHKCIQAFQYWSGPAVISQSYTITSMHPSNKTSSLLLQIS